MRLKYSLRLFNQEEVTTTFPSTGNLGTSDLNSFFHHYGRILYTHSYEYSEFSNTS